MRKQRDTHPRPRAVRGGRLEVRDLVRQDLRFASDECQRALQAHDLKTAREHVALAHKFVLAAAARTR